MLVQLYIVHGHKGIVLILAWLVRVLHLYEVGVIRKVVAFGIRAPMLVIISRNFFL